MPRRKKIDIWRAAAGGEIDTVSAWLAAGNDIESRDINNLTIIHFAAYRGRAEMVKFLIEHGAEVNTSNEIGFTPLMVASQEGYSVETVRLIVAAGADVNKATVRGETALMIAADRSSNPTIVSYLLDSGAEVNFRSNSGATAIMDASFRGNLEIVRISPNAAQT